MKCEIKNKPYLGYIEKLKQRIELKGRVIKYKPVAKLSKKKSVMKGCGLEPKDFYVNYSYKTANNKTNGDPKFKYEKVLFGLGADRIFFGKKIKRNEKNGEKLVTRNYFSIVFASDGSFWTLTMNPTSDELTVKEYDQGQLFDEKIFKEEIFSRLDNNIIPNPNNVHKIKFSDKIINKLNQLTNLTDLRIKEIYNQDKKKIKLINIDKQTSSSPIILKLKHNEKDYEVDITKIPNEKKNFYMIFNETKNIPIATFSDDSIKYLFRRVYEALETKDSIIIKIGQDSKTSGSIAELLGDSSLLNSIINWNEYSDYWQSILRSISSSKESENIAEYQARHNRYNY